MRCLPFLLVSFTIMFSTCIRFALTVGILFFFRTKNNIPISACISVHFPPRVCALVVVYLSYFEQSCMNTGVQGSLWYADFHPFGNILSSGMAGITWLFYVYLSQNPCTVLHCSGINLPSHQQCMRVCFSASFLTLFSFLSFFFPFPFSLPSFPVFSSLSPCLSFL